MKTCRFCSNLLKFTFVDLGTAPLCQRHVTPERYRAAESVYPQQVYVCEKCWLVQLPQYVAREEIFDAEYGYFSSYVPSWLEHAKRYVTEVTDRFGLDAPGKQVLEIASNDGYLLQYFKERGITCQGVEPTLNTAQVALDKGIPTLCEFFGLDSALKIRRSHGPYDLILGNNVLAHVPDINDFVAGIKQLLADDGVVTMEFPVLSQMIKNNYFDTIYHEHFSYLSFTVAWDIFAKHGLVVFDMDTLPTHGGSVRIYARHENDWSKQIHPTVYSTISKEAQEGHGSLSYYSRMGERVRESKRSILEWFITQKRLGKEIVGFGAPGKGNTLLNYCGIRTDMMTYTVDDNLHKQYNFLPGSRIPIFPVDMIKMTKPDFVVILPWNLQTEIVQKLSFIKEWGGRCVVLLPSVAVI